MRKIWIVAAVGILLTGCSGRSDDVAGNQSSEAVKPLDANGIAANLKAAGLPISDVKIVTEASDDNHLLGRPGQYTSKVFFYDIRHPRSDGEENENTIEVFASAGDAKTRHDYIESVTKGMPMMTQYQMLNGNSLVRLSKGILPSEADGYKKVLATSRIGS